MNAPARVKTPLLDSVQTPEDLRALPEADLVQLAAELRQETIDAVSVTGGHLGAGLGVVELTVAIHDPFGAAHSSTSISAGLGMAVARDLTGGDNRVICVIGDGAMSAGMAYEAINNAGALDTRLIVVLNDNRMSIAAPTGALSAYLARITSSRSYFSWRKLAKKFARRLPTRWERRLARLEKYSRHVWQGGAWFEELGFYYVGPIDGHDLGQLLPVLRNVRDAAEGPILVHVVTQKGKGYAPAEASSDKYHGVSQFNVVTGAQVKSPAKAPSYTRV